ncbi:SLAC1 anion channel family protein [Scleromatobacter humisilvae]|uniref:SLAC1 anion channel family protein n=1 Tax=Scleromatobacter humisilvae TaxID=2897159 RepID=A0A9X1YNQ5_9BURK|nr:SLAC1 anion channel family protein [Scleromatobacter humisilvae]MCK9689411.1 SLAC1 anion channel family protein [Scleromatobacter humisilvae]
MLRDLMDVAPPVTSGVGSQRRSVRYLPVNLFGAVMGLAGLSLAWRSAHRVFGVPAAIGDAIGVVALATFLVLATGYLAKCLCYPAAVKAEFEHPVGGNFFGTITIAIMLLSVVVSRYAEVFGEVLWTCGTALTFVLTFVVVGRLLHGKVDPVHATPPWLISGVGTLDVAVTGSTMPMEWAREVDLFGLSVGTMMAVVFFMMVFSRVVHQEPLPATMVPSLIVMIAPLEVGFLAYVGMTHAVDMFAGLLFHAGLFLFITLSPQVFRLNVPFATSWWAVSFPMAALSIAALQYAAYAGTWVLSGIAGLALLLVSVVVAVLSVQTLHRLFTRRLLVA